MVIELYLIEYSYYGEINQDLMQFIIIKNFKICTPSVLQALIILYRLEYLPMVEMIFPNNMNKL